MIQGGLPVRQKRTSPALLGSGHRANDTRPLQRAQGTGPPIMPMRFLLAGVLCIFGGESFCILGPLRYERLIHVACHIILYSGIALALIGTLLYLSGKRGNVRR
jgi:hypothetical protein